VIAGAFLLGGNTNTRFNTMAGQVTSAGTH
jgi:hypothetical protein